MMFFSQLLQQQDGDDPVKITLTMLNVVLIISTLLYIFCLIIAKKKFSKLHRINPGLGLKKLLVLSVFLVCAIRIMTFVGVTCMDVANVRAHYSPSPTVNYSLVHFDFYSRKTEWTFNPDIARADSKYDHTSDTSSDERYQSFYDASMAVLFDLPNTIVVSTYVLLTLVWSECFLQSRAHTENAIKWKRRWLLGYTIFNSCLYFTQLVLYALVFLDGSKLVKNILYAAMTAMNFSAVALVTFLYFYLNIKFAGFPSRSTEAKKSLKRISKVLALWTLSRILWAIVMLIVFIRGIELLHYSSTLLFFLFMGCEISPIMVMLDYSYMQIIGFENNQDEDALEVSASLVEQEFMSSLNGNDDWLGSLGFDLDDLFHLNSRSDSATDDEEPLMLLV